MQRLKPTNTWDTTTLKKVDKKSIEEGFFCLGKKENKEKIETQLKDALKTKMVDNDKAIEIQYKYLIDKLQSGYQTEGEVKTKNKRTITKISSYER